MMNKMGLVGAGTRTIKVLLIEDDHTDLELLSLTLGQVDDSIKINIKHADRLSSAVEMLETIPFDVVLADLTLPDSRELQTVVTIRERFPETPLIVLTGSANKDMALEAIRRGAQDYLEKSHINNNTLLVRTILHSIERQKLLVELEKRMNEIKTLRGIIPMCAWCRKIRDDNGYWKKVEEYLEEHTDASFTHGMCEECSKKAVAERNELRIKVG
jgi:DNA-binding NtrC family response regulator